MIRLAATLQAIYRQIVLTGLVGDRQGFAYKTCFESLDGFYTALDPSFTVTLDPLLGLVNISSPVAPATGGAVIEKRLAETVQRVPLVFGQRLTLRTKLDLNGLTHSDASVDLGVTGLAQGIGVTISGGGVSPTYWGWANGPSGPTSILLNGVTTKTPSIEIHLSEAGLEFYIDEILRGVISKSDCPEVDYRVFSILYARLYLSTTIATQSFKIGHYEFYQEPL